MSGHLHKPRRQLDGFSLYFSNDVAIIVIDRGENRLNLEYLKALNLLLDDVEREKSCKALITTGKGKFYGNGLDLKWMSDKSSEVMAEFFTNLLTTLKRILLYPLPTVAALNGHAYAGGALFAFAHDLRVQNTERGWLCFNEVFINRQFSSFNLSYLSIKIGLGKNYTDAITLGRRYNAQEAFSSGLVHAMPTEQMLLPESIRLLKAFYGKTGYPRDSMVKMKEAVYKSAIEEYEKECGPLKAKL